MEITWPLPLLVAALVGLIGAMLFFKNICMPRDFLKNQEEREKLKRKMIEMQNKNILED
ncbi:MAG: hypothetical protein GF401_11890 [Chitinivibrionales bacterium]|nr:hypothetical protein [Chitinivibrionales bacterium]